MWGKLTFLATLLAKAHGKFPYLAISGIHQNWEAIFCDPQDFYFLYIYLFLFALILYPLFDDWRLYFVIDKIFIFCMFIFSFLLNFVSSI